MTTETGAEGAGPESVGRGTSRWVLPAVSLLHTVTAGLLCAAVLNVKFFWDEGWTLCASRELARSGIYACRLQGELIGPYLAAGYPMGLLTAIFSRLFGDGFYEVRTGFALLTLLFVVSYFSFSKRLCGVAGGLTAALFLIFLSPDHAANPLMLGAQIMSEVPFLLATLLGYRYLLDALAGRRMALPIAALMFSLAFLLKSHALLFIPLALLGSAFLEWRNGERKRAKLFALTFLLMAVLCEILARLSSWAMKITPHPFAEAPGLTLSAAMVFNAQARLNALQLLFGGYLPALAGLLLFPLRRKHSTPEDSIFRSLWILGGAWMGWFALAAPFFPRNIFVPSTVGALCLADFLVRTSPSTVRSLSHRLLGDRRESGWWARLPVLIACAFVLPVSGIQLIRYLNATSNADYFETAAFLQRVVSTNEIVETYDSPLIATLPFRFHYPPAKYHSEKLRAYSTSAATMPEYDPLASTPAPTWLVDGPWSHGIWGVYDETIRRGQWTAAAKFGEFRIYRNPAAASESSPR